MFNKFKGTKVIDEKNDKTFYIGDKELNQYTKILLINRKDPFEYVSYIEIIKDDTEVFFDIFNNRKNNDFATNNIKSVLQLLSGSKVDIYLYNYTHKKYTEYHNYYLKITPPVLRSNFNLFNDNETLLKNIIESSGYQIHNIYEFDFNDECFKKRVN